MDQKLMDLLQGTTHLEGIDGWATITQIHDDTEPLHHMEPKPNKKKDRRGLEILSSPDGPASLPTIWGTKEQKKHRGHVLLQSTSPTTPAQSRDTMTAISSIAGDNRMHTSSDLQDTLTPPRKPVNTPRLLSRVGLPNKYGEASWISDNQLLQHVKSSVVRGPGPVVRRCCLQSLPEPAPRRPPTHTSDSDAIDVYPTPTSLQFRVLYTYVRMHLYILGA